MSNEASRRQKLPRSRPSFRRPTPAPSLCSGWTSSFRSFWNNAQKLEQDFREAQAEVNEECDRMLKVSSVAPARMLSQMAEAGIGEPGVTVHSGNGRILRSQAGCAAQE